VERYLKVITSTAGRTGASYKDVGEALYQLGSAGLTVNESFAALDSVMKITIGLESDMANTTRLVAAIYHAWGETLTKAGTLEEKFAYITDVLTNAYKRHLAELGELSEAIKASGAAAQMAGMSFEELVAILGVAHDHMIRGSAAGRKIPVYNSSTSFCPRRIC